jgi:phosphatidylglycerophosphatase A
MKSAFGWLSKLFATVFFIGYLPVAPGTWGSLTGLGAVWFIKPTTLQLASAIIVIFVIGIIAAHHAEKAYRQKDCGHIVIDELVGYLISVLFLPVTPAYLVAAFFLFRFFDILKPPPIRNIERITSGGFGIMLDDIIAGIFTNAVLQLTRAL